MSVVYCPRGSTQHLPWRTRLTAVTCYAYEAAGDVGAAAKCAAHAMEKVRLSECGNSGTVSVKSKWVG